MSRCGSSIQSTIMDDRDSVGVTEAVHLNQLPAGRLSPPSYNPLRRTPHLGYHPVPNR